jgi:hypothetical protein
LQKPHAKLHNTLRKIPSRLERLLFSLFRKTKENMDVISSQIIAKSVQALAELKLWNGTDHYGEPDVDSVLTACGAYIDAGSRAAETGSGA